MNGRFGAALRAVVAFAATVAACDAEFRFEENEGRDGGADGAVVPGADSGQDGAGRDASGAYGPCSTDGDCARFGLACEPLSRTCVACTEDVHCGGTSPRCDSAIHRCVECGTAADCPGGVCDSKTRRCVRSCDASVPNVCGSGVECEDSRCKRCEDDLKCGGATPRCERSIGLCVECVGDVDCAGRGLRCDRTRGVCTECLGPSDCPAARPLCDKTGACLAP